MYVPKMSITSYTLNITLHRPVELIIFFNKINVNVHQSCNGIHEVLNNLRINSSNLETVLTENNRIDIKSSCTNSQRRST